MLIFLIALLFVPGITVYGNQKFGSYNGIIRNDKLFIPLRGVFTDLGFQVSWNDNTGSITLINSSNTLIITTGKVNLNGTEKPLTVSPIFHSNRIYIPLRFVSESLGAEVYWNKKTQTATILYGGRKINVYLQNNNKLTSYSRTYNINGKRFSVNVVEIPLHAAVPDMVVAGDTIGNTEELASMAKRNSAVVAINGTFFNAYSNKTDNSHGMPYGNIIRNGQVLYRSNIGTTCGFLADGTAKFGQLPLRRYNHDLADYGWNGTITAVGAGPRLLTNGEVTVNPKKEGFTSEKILNMCGARSAIGVKNDGTVMLVTTVATINELAQIMLKLGSYNAMNLDGGASSGLWYGGKYITKPGRLLSNALVFK